MHDAHDETADAEAQPRSDGSGRGWKIAAGFALVAAFAAMGALGSLLFFGGGLNIGSDVRACIIEAQDAGSDGSNGHDKPANCPPKGAKRADGLVQKTTSGGFTMRTIRNGRLSDTVKLHVREPDRPYIDVAHAQTHAALGQPIRVYTLRIDGKDSVVYMEDAPLLR